MASRTVIRHYVDGSTAEFVRKKQGRHISPPELKRDFLIQILTTQSQGVRFEEARRKFNMSKSAFGDLVIFNGLQALDKLLS